MPARSPRRPGRPARRPARPSPRVRDRLLHEAGRLFSRHGVARVSLRQIAESAGVTPAMVHYYFGDKQGLCGAMLGRALARVLDRVRHLERLDELPEVLVGTLAAEPWIPPLLVQEILSEGGHFRDRFVAEYASQMTEIVPRLVQAEIAAGRYRASLDPRLALLSLIGMVAFPFVARPVLERVLGVDYDAEVVDRLAEHTLRVFLAGVRA